MVNALGSDPQVLASSLIGQITPAQKTAWEQGTVQDWATETYNAAKNAAYTIGSPSGCSSDATPVPLPAGYVERAKSVAAVQLERAGVRLALVLNRALGKQGVSVSISHRYTT